jgi:hypothetical protein
MKRCSCETLAGAKPPTVMGLWTTVLVEAFPGWAIAYTHPCISWAVGAWATSSAATNTVEYCT